MCRDGFTTPCETKGCLNIVTCRDRPRFCQPCWDSFAIDDDPCPTCGHIKLEPKRFKEAHPSTMIGKQ